MGYCYEGNKLCCDKCGAAGYVRKRPCPSGYCQAMALCKTCNAEIRKDGRWKGAHAHCSVASAKYKAERALEQHLLDEGRWLRKAAVGTDDGRVKVWFRNKDGEEKLGFMHPQVYKALGYQDAKTWEDYERLAEKLGCTVEAS